MALPEHIAVAILSGVKDGLNPYMLSGIACCVIFLALVTREKQRLVLAGRCLSAAMFLTTFTLAWDINLLLLVSARLNAIFQLIPLGFAVALILTGYTLLRQWWMSKKGTPGLQFPGFRRLDSTFSLICFSVILGVLIATINMLWPKDPNFYLGYYTLLSSGDLLWIAFFLVIYSAVFTCYLALGCWLYVVAVNSAKFQRMLADSLSMVRITCSAVCLALGMGLVFLYIAL